MNSDEAMKLRERVAEALTQTLWPPRRLDNTRSLVRKEALRGADAALAAVGLHIEANLATAMDEAGGVGPFAEGLTEHTMRVLVALGFPIPEGAEE